MHVHVRMCMGARASMSTFSSQLSQIVLGDDRFKLVLGPVKLPARVTVKVSEYADENDGDWPFTCQVGDVLRGTIVGRDGDAVGLAVNRVIATFDLREGNGRLKNM